MQYSSNQYLVSFDRPGLGKHHVLDTEVKVVLHAYKLLCFDNPLTLNVESRPTVDIFNI